MDVRPWLQDLYAPAVLVAASPAAEAIVQTKNGLGLVDLLRPYSSVYKLNVPVRVGEASVRVQDLRVRFYDAATMYQPSPERMEEHLQEVLKSAAQRHARLDPSPELLQRCLSDNPPDLRELTPWFDAYRSEFLRMLRFGDHETLDYPVACLYAIPADVANPALHYDNLAGSPMVLPPLMQQDVMYSVRDKDFPRHYVLLLDVAAGMNEKRAMENLAAIRKLYGEANCSLLRINSGNGDRAHSGAPVDFFARYQHACLRKGGAGEPSNRPPPPPGGVGAYLTVQDLDAVSGFVRGVVSRTLLPRLEERIARLNASITATRRGLRNRLNRFWKGSAEDRQSDRPYPWHSVESQMRQLGDLAFLLRQYAFAESTYRLAAQDYLAEGNSKWYAGVEEMIGLCTVLGEPSDPIAAVLLQNDPMKYFMRAYEHYIKPPAAVVAAANAAAAAALSSPTGAAGPSGPATTAANGGSGGPGPGAGGAAASASSSPALAAASQLGRMLATRVVLLGAAVQAGAGRYRATSDALMRAQSEEENARAGLLLEQSAYCMLYARPPLVRKFAFQMVLAGIRYICCQQKRIAIHAYRQVLGLYLGKKWRYIEEHLNAVLGAQCVEYGDKERALWHHCALLDCGHRPAAQQASNVAQFLNLLAGVRDQLAIVQDGVCLVDSLPLPLVNRHDVRVLCSDTACYGGPAARTVPDSAWLKMEACCTSGSNNWLVDGGAAKQERDHEEYTMCVSGEEVGVQVEFRNPLAVMLKITNVQLICTFTPEGAAAAGPGPGAEASSSSSSGALGTIANPGSSAAVPVVPDGLHPLLPGTAPAALTNQPASQYVHIPEAQLTLHPGEVLVEVLRLLPRAPGWLRVTGVTWTLNGVAHGRITFDVKGRRRKRPKGTRPGQLKHFPPHRRLLFQVVPAMPRLELLADPLPPALYSGELCRVMMRIRNSGGLPLRSLALVVGHPEAVCPATDANKDRPLLESLTDPREVVHLSKVPAVARGTLQLYRLWPGRELAPGEVLEWPLWLHPRGVGALKLPLVWYGEPAVASSKGSMRHRTLRIYGSVSVQPLLAARPAVCPSPTHLSHHLLRLAVENSKEGERVVLQQVAAVTAPMLSQQPGTAGPHQGTARSGAATPGSTTAASTPTALPRQPPPGWRIALLGSQGAPGQAPGPASAPASSTPASLDHGNAAAAGPQPPVQAQAALPRNLPLALPLQPGESTNLFLQLLAPPPPPPPATAGSTRPAGGREAGSGPAGTGAPPGLPPGLPTGATAAASHGAAATTPSIGPSPPASGMTTPGRLDDPSAAAVAVAQAAEAVRSLALTHGGGGGGGGLVVGSSGRLPYVDGSDAALQRLNLFGPGVLAHFYRRARRGMVSVVGTNGGLGGGTGGVAAGAARGVAPQGPAGWPGAGALPPPPPQPGSGPSGGPSYPGAAPAPPLPPSPSLSFGPGNPSPYPGTYPPPQLQPPQPSLARGTSFGPGTAAAPAGGPQAGQFAMQQPPQPTGTAGPGRPPAPSVPMGPGAPPVPSAGGAAGPTGRPGPVVPLADPPLDLLLLWHVASSQRTGPHQGQQRLGLCRPFDTQTGRDLSGCLQAQTAPIRMLLTGPNGASSAASAAGSAGPVIRHDFRKSSLAVVPLRLVVRNNTGLEARLQIEVGEGWQSTDAAHSWQASTAILGQSPGGPGTGHALPPGSVSAVGPTLGVPGGSSLGPGGSGVPAVGGMLPAAGPASAGPTGGGGAPGAAAGSPGVSLGGSMMAITYQAGLPPCPEYTWVGPTSVAVPRVQPGCEVEVPLSVAVFRPGAYSITGYRCTAYMDAAGAVEVQRGEPLCFRVEG